jgi:hypothetical protein
MNTNTDMTKISDVMLAEIVNALPPVFDSHAVIREMMRRYPQQYTTDLFGHVENKDPILSFHSTIGVRLTRFEDIERTRRISSDNVRGQKTENQEWRRKQIALGQVETRDHQADEESL